MSEKLQLDKVEEYELSQNSDPIQEEIGKKKKKGNTFSFLNNMSTNNKMIYGFGVILTFVALYMLMDDGAQSEKIKKETAAKNMKASGDIYNQKTVKKTVKKSSAQMEKKQKLLASMREKADEKRRSKLLQKVEHKNSIKNRDASKDKKYSKTVFSESVKAQDENDKDKNVTSAISVTNVTKHINKKRVKVNRSIKYEVLRNTKIELRCLSVKKSEKLFKIVNNSIFPFREKITKDKKLDGLLVEAKRNGKSIKFVRLYAGNYILISNTVFCDMDTRGK